MNLKIQEFFDPATFTLTYIAYDENSKDAVVIDPVLDYDPASSKVSFESLEKVNHFIDKENLHLHFILETHAHADHLSGAQTLKNKYPKSQTAIGARITEVQKVFKNIFQMSENFLADGNQFDKLLSDEEIFSAGTLKIKTIYTPGHTPACVSFLIGDALFTGDALFMPDLGTGRCDFPAGSATELYHSIKDRIYSLPETTSIYAGHDYPNHRDDIHFKSTVGEEKNNNAQLRNDTSLNDFLKIRKDRDKTLKAPRLLFQSVQVNINAGHLPPFLKIPILVPGPVSVNDASK